MIIRTLLILLLLSSSFNMAHGEEPLQKVLVADPYIDVHTGHGKSYPIFHVIERGEIIEIIVRHTSWFKIRNEDGVEGWVAQEQMELTLSPASQEQIALKTYTHEDYVERRWEYGLLGGRFSSADSLTMYAAYLFNKSLAAEFSWDQVLASNSSSDLYKIALVMQPFPTLKYSPYITMGTGVIKVEPKSTLVQPEDSSDQFSNFGIGIRTYLSKRIILRLEYSNYIIFSANSTNDENEEVKEWKAGFAVFF